jgi:NAD+ kinase
MKRVGILYHPMKESAVSLAHELEEYLTEEGVAAWSCSAWESEVARSRVAGSDLLLSIGGDGTILRAAQAVVPGKIPITGINLGNVGFMTELSVAEARDGLRRLVAGEGWADERALLEAEVVGMDSVRPGGFYALNDVVLGRGSVVRTVLVRAAVDGRPLTTYKADGVIVATATGSTGYAYAAGGPILHPQSRDMVMVPIMPHLSASYCLVLPPETSIELELEAVHPASLSVDGHTNLTVERGVVVRTRVSNQTLTFLRIHPESDFYSTLDRRLKGKQ